MLGARPWPARATGRGIGSPVRPPPRARHVNEAGSSTDAGASAASAEPVDLDREQAGRVVDLQQVEDIEAVGLADHHLGRREGESEIAGRRQPTFIAVVQQILLGGADHLLRTLGRIGDALAHYECLARQVRGRLGPSTYPIDTIEPKAKAVVLGGIFTDELADDALNVGKYLLVPGDEMGIGGRGEEKGAKADC